MAIDYKRHNFADGQVLTAEQLNDMEDGLCSACNELNEVHECIKIPAYIYNDKTIKVNDKTYNSFIDLASENNITFTTLGNYYDFFYQNEYSSSDVEWVHMSFSSGTDDMGYISSISLRGEGQCYVGDEDTEERELGVREIYIFDCTLPEYDTFIISYTDKYKPYPKNEVDAKLNGMKVPAYILYGFNGEHRIKVQGKTYNSFFGLADDTGIHVSQLNTYYDFYYISSYNDGFDYEGAEFMNYTENVPLCFTFSRDNYGGYYEMIILQGTGLCYIGTIDKPEIGERTIVVSQSYDETTFSISEIDEEIEDIKTDLFIYDDGYIRKNIGSDEKLTLYDIVGTLKSISAIHSFFEEHNIYYVQTSSYNNFEVSLLQMRLGSSELTGHTICSINNASIKVSMPHYSMESHTQKPFNVTIQHLSPKIEISKYKRQVQIPCGFYYSEPFDVAGKLSGQSWLFTDYASSSVTGDYTAMFGFNNTCFGNGNIIGGIKNNITGRAICVVGEKNLVEQCATGAIIGGTLGYVNDANTIMAIGNGVNADNRSNILEMKNDGTIIIKPSGKDTITITYDKLLEVFSNN